MTTPVLLRPHTDIQATLRRIADECTEDVEDCTLIIGENIYHLGTANDAQAAQEAIWNMTYGINKLMNGAVQT